jgi:hypothetical protein
MHVSSCGPAVAAAMSPHLPGVQYRLVSDETRRGQVLLQLEQAATNPAWRAS